MLKGCAGGFAGAVSPVRLPVPLLPGRPQQWRLARSETLIDGAKVRAYVVVPVHSRVKVDLNLGDVAELAFNISTILDIFTNICTI